MAEGSIVTAPWQAQEDEICGALQSGRSIIFVGGRGTGKTTLCNDVLRKLAATPRLACMFDLGTEFTDSDSPSSLISAIVGLPNRATIPSTPEAALFIQSELKSLGLLSRVVLLDGIQSLERVPWGMEVADYLRALLSVCPELVLGLFGRPSLNLLFEGVTSPLSNICARFYARPANHTRVIEHYAHLGHDAATAMRALRLVGGHPTLIPDAVQALTGGATDSVAAAEVASRRSEFLRRQFDDLSPRAREAVLGICALPRTTDGLRQYLGGSAIDGVLLEGTASLVLSVVDGHVQMTSAAQTSWLAEEAARRRASARPALSNRDVEAYRTISTLEWRARDWISTRLSSAAPLDWWETRIPDAPRSRAEERQAAERSASAVAASESLVDYLDFSDVREIVRYRPNWLGVFGPVIGEWQATLEEAMQRLEAIRRKVAHSRPVGSDELALAQASAQTILEIFER